MSVVNEFVARSKTLASKFEIEVLPLQFAETIDDLNQVSAGKLTRVMTTGAQLAWKLLVRRPAAVYFTPCSAGPAFYRDCIYVAIMKGFGVRRIYHMHGKGVAPQLAGKWKRSLYEWAFRDAWVIHLSPRLTFDTADVVKEQRTMVVANGLPDQEGASTRERPLPHPGPPRILFLSNMIRTKGPLVLLDALARLKRRGIPFKATFAGARSNDGCMEAFEAALIRDQLHDHVEYLGPVYGDAKDRLFRTHDIFAFPAYYEAFPLVVLEAMQCSLPVVASFEGSIPDLIDDGNTGYLVKHRDATALAERLATLLQDAALRERMGAQGRERYVQHYTLDHFEQSLTETIERCLESAT